MAKLIGYFHIVLAIARLKLSDLVMLAFGIKLDKDPDATAPPYTQAQLQALATTVQNNLGAQLTADTPTLTAKQKQSVNDLLRAIVAVKGYVETVANAKASGVRAAFEEIVNRIGFTAKAPAQLHARIFESLLAVAGSFHIRVPSEGPSGMTYVYRYGITTAINVLPATWQPDIPLSVTELVVNGLTSGTIVAVQYAVTFHPKHTAAGAVSPPNLGKHVTELAVNKAGKVTVVHGSSLLHFSDPIYVVVP